MKKLLLLALSSALFVGVAYAAPEAENGKIATHSATGVKAAPELLRSIKQRIAEENTRPRTRYLSPATLGTTYAAYYNNMRRAIEKRGTERFPQVEGRKLYGELIMDIFINHDGRVLNMRVKRSSNDRKLDRQAMAIAASVAPFGEFTPVMRRDADQFSVAMRFNFTRRGVLETALLSNKLASVSEHAEKNVGAIPLEALPETINLRIEEENSRPYKRYLSPATLGTTYAAYYDNMRRAIEKRGTEHFPQKEGDKLYGELVMGILVNHDGRVLEAHVEKSSGIRLLDRQAEAIVASAAPFGEFTPAMKKDTDQFDVSVLFQFADDGTLKTTLLP